MGVKKLTTFVESDFVRWRYGKEVHGKLVVDGNSLVHSLHTREWSNGGQYREYRSAVRQFYLKLLNSGITPIVIFDGVNDERKTDVVMKRRQDWVNIIHKRITDNASRNIKCSGCILPTLCSEVYRMALYDLNIEFYVADGEADPVIARVANHYSCPVLSNDSDFFVFRLIGGYIPYSNFHWKSSVVKADIYHRDEFAKQFGFRDSSLLYVIPAIVGNDFILPSSVPIMLDLMLKGENEIRSICRNLKMFSSLVEYLASTSSTSHELKCRQAKEWYEIPHSLSCQELVETTQLRHKNGDQFPQWLVELFHKGHLPSAALDVAIHCKAIFRMIPDNFHKESSIVAGQMIRQQIYSLLGCDEVVEIFRHKLTITGVKVSSTQLTSSCNNVTLASVESMTNRERQTLFYSVCNCDERALNHLTGQYSDWKFVATTVRLWISNTEPPRKLVKALLLCFTLCSGLNDGRLDSLRRRDHMPVTFRKSQRWLDALHSFMQWQVIYHTAWTLNALLNEPMTVFSPAYLYDGEIIMYLASAENIDHLIACLVPYQDRTLHRYLEKSALDLQSQTTQQTIVVPTTECISMAPASENLDVMKQGRTKDNFRTVVDCPISDSQLQSNPADNVCTLPLDSLQTAKHDLDTSNSIQLMKSETEQNDPNPKMIKALATLSNSLHQVESQVSNNQKTAAKNPKKQSRRKRQVIKDGISIETPSPDSSAQFQIKTQAHPPIKSSGLESKMHHAHPSTKIGENSKAIETPLSNSADKLGRQLKASQPHITEQQSKASPARPQAHQSNTDKIHPHFHHSSESQTQQTKARLAHSSISSRFASHTEMLQPQITAENTEAENTVKAAKSVDKLLPHCVPSNNTQNNGSPTLSAAKPKHRKRTAQSGVKAGGIQATNITQINPSKDGSFQGQLKTTVHSEQLSQQSHDLAQVNTPPKKVRKRRHPRHTTTSQMDTSRKQSLPHNESHKKEKDTVHNTPTGSSTTEQSSTNPPLPRTLQNPSQSICPLINSSGLESIMCRAHPTTKIGESSKAFETPLPNSASQPGQQLKGSQPHITEHNRILQPQITAENIKAENTVTTMTSVDKLLPNYASSGSNASSTLSAAKPRRKKRAAHSGVKADEIQSTNKTQTSPNNDDSLQEQLKTVHSKQLSQQSHHLAEVNTPQKKVHNRRHPRHTTTFTAPSQIDTSKKQSLPHKKEEDTVHDAAKTDSSTTGQRFTSTNPPLPQTLQNPNKAARRQQRSAKKY